MTKRILFCLLLSLALLQAMALAAFASPLLVTPTPGISSQIFVPSTGCGCHQSLHQDWSLSMHSKALTDPLFLSKVAEANQASDGKLGAFCFKCHGPIGTITNEIGKNTSPVSGEGVTCSFCHQVVGLKGKPANTSQLVETDGVRRAQIEDPQAPHPAQYSEFHKTAEFCGGCHNVDHPVNGMHLEATYSEWKKSPYAKEGIVCQDCHMSQPGQIGPFTGQAAGAAPQRDNLYRMSFVGANVAQGNAEEATARLKSAATLELSAPEIVSPGTEASVSVTITNAGAGHYLPTGLTEVREMWLEVVATTPDGKEIPVGKRVFGTILEDDKGNAPVELWDAVKIKSDDRIPPRESVTADYSFKMPEAAETATLKAALYYRSASDEFAKKAGVANPVTTMVEADRKLFASEEAKSGSPKDAKPAEKPETSSRSGLLVGLVAGLLVAAAGIGAWLAFAKRK